MRIMECRVCSSQGSGTVCKHRRPSSRTPVERARVFTGARVGVRDLAFPKVVKTVTATYPKHTLKAAEERATIASHLPRKGLGGLYGSHPQYFSCPLGSVHS